MTFKILCLHGMSQNAEVFRTRLGRLPHKAKTLACFHYESAPHSLPVKAEDEEPMRTWYVRDPISGSIDSASLRDSLGHLDRAWAAHGPFDGVLGFSMGGSMAVIVASLPARFPGLRFVMVGGARELPAAALQELGVHTGEAGAGNVPQRLPLPSLHLVGRADKVVPPASSHQLAARFAAPLVIEHEQGHCIPSRAAMLDSYVQFFRDVHEGAPKLETPKTRNPDAPSPPFVPVSVPVSEEARGGEKDEGGAVCVSDAVALLQAEEMNVLDSIFSADIHLTSALPAAAGDPAVSFDFQLTCSGAQVALPARWLGNLWLRVRLPAHYPELGAPHIEVRTAGLGLHEFRAAHRASLLRVVRAAAGSGGEMVLMDCMQAGNDWLSGGQWEGDASKQQDEQPRDPQEKAPGQGEEGDLNSQQEQLWIAAATEQACTAAARTRLKDKDKGGKARQKDKDKDVEESDGGGEDEAGAHTCGGVWRYTVGLVGKPSAGKSTFYNAVTRAILDSRGGRKVAEVAAHPFTTIEPNIGPGWYLSGQQDQDEGEGEGGRAQEPARVRSSAYGRVGGRRLLPVVVKDVAGLVPGAYQGRGKGNKFLGDLCDADVLVHVVDCTGQADRDGNRVVMMMDSAEGAASSGSSPAEDVAWIREELHRWIFGNVRAKWESVVRRGQGSRGWQRAVSLFSGYQGFDPKHIIQKAAQHANLNLDKASQFTDFEIHCLVAHYLSVRFPTCLALNKIDELPQGGEDIVRQCQAMAVARGEVAVPVSARAECWVLQQQLSAQPQGPQTQAQAGKAGGGQGQGQGQGAVEEALLRSTLSRWGSTGVLEAISAAVQLSPPLLCYPVSDLDAELPLGWSAREQGVAETAATPPPRLQDCVQLKPSSTVLDVFEALKQHAIPNVALHGEFVRADGKGLGVGGGRRQQLRRDQVIDDHNCVLRIYSNKRYTWQKDCV